MKKTWGGRFLGKTDPLVERFTESYSFDRRLLPQDLAGSRVHVEQLRRAGLLTTAEARKLRRGLDRLAREAVKSGAPRGSFEDVHSAVEARLIRLAGEAGARLHTGRSRNDQVATDLKLYLREESGRILAALAELLRTLARLSHRERATVMPGYTHLQRAMPVTLGHHLAAYGFMLARDGDRFLAGLRRGDTLPLGSGALAGTNHPFARRAAARALGFAAPSENSLDAVSDRDAAFDFLAACASTQVHLSRLCEDLVLWNSSEFGFLELPDALATGSSLMPQKKNPDVPELVRGRAALVLGSLVGLLTLLKGLPLAYNRDLQEDKRLVFPAADAVRDSLAAMERLLAGCRWNRARMREAVERDPAILATDVADLLVAAGIPFRRAHEAVGAAVRRALALGVRLQDLPAREIRRLLPGVSERKLRALTPESSVAAKRAEGGTAPRNVAVQARRLGFLAASLARTARRARAGRTP